MQHSELMFYINTQLGESSNIMASGKKKKQYEIYKGISFKEIKCSQPENNTTFIFKDTHVSK